MDGFNEQPTSLLNASAPTAAYPISCHNKIYILCTTVCLIKTHFTETLNDEI